MSEQRGYVRFKEEGNVNIKTEGDAANIVKGDLINIGFGGFSACLREKIDMGTIIQFELTAEIREIPLTGRGKIKYVTEVKERDMQGYRVGVEFTEVDKENVVMLLNRISNKICKDKKKKARPDLYDTGIF